MIIVLLGYMASGKSVIGNQLAEILDFQFIDLDTYLEDKEGLSIAELFDAKGELYFRKKEAEYLKKIISDNDCLVLSLGGGTPCYANNMELIRASEKCRSFYFKRSIADLVSRLKDDKEKRPLVAHLNSVEALTEFIGKHLFERSEFYGMADRTLLANHRTDKELLEEIVYHLLENGLN